MTAFNVPHLPLGSNLLATEVVSSDMKLCSQCRMTAWPFFLAFFIAAISVFLTWLTLSYSQFDYFERIAGCGAVFLVVGGTLLHYMLACMRRHCHHTPHKHATH